MGKGKIEERDLGSSNQRKDLRRGVYYILVFSSEGDTGGATTNDFWYHHLGSTAENKNLMGYIRARLNWQ